MTVPRFHGVIPPVVTPRTSEGDVDLPALGTLIEHLLDGGVQGLFMLGSSGEVAFLTDTERKAILAEAVRVTAGRVPIMVGVNDMTASRVIEQIRIAEDAGVDAVLATAPFYALPSAREIEQHFYLLAAATTLPIFAYDVPVRVHNKLTTDLIMRLARDGVLAGVKDSSGDDVSFRRLVNANRAAGEPLVLLTGHEVVADGALFWGAHGIVPGLGNVDPRRYVEMFDAAQRGDWNIARALQDELCALFEIVFQAQGVSGEAAGLGAFKIALARIGVINSARMSAPIDQLTDETIQRIQHIVDRAGVLVK
ncbi:dihydrodipicolinate synthase family protein [Subtercola sp. PAMC28395]|uniref:dihydrodipicolinate synthase family protein n=1 Tax=Subtercola sp. PAMC28395 TaxID=2846775 RepID=UPI001C0B1A55|nr:dihydrodipicolinate synthase family protein [Subtercola sp. PAMC28395]QWT24732.1 dihydrodipicolinate synthase family protein [Subtercola sp. PAMC28395]